MLHQLNAQYGRILLLPIEHKDIEFLRLLRNRERKWFVYSEEISEKAQEEWFARYRTVINDYMFSIYRKDNAGSTVGFAALYHVDEIKKTGEFGRIIIDKEKASERGLGYDSTVCACLIGFEQLHLDKIMLEVFSNNISAIKTYEKAGFVSCKENNSIIYMELTKNNLNLPEEESD